MKGCLVIAVAIGALVGMSSPGIACDQAEQEQSRFTCFQLKRADATRIAKKLQALLRNDGDVDVVSDKESNTVFLRACPETIQQVKEILDRLDVGLPDYLTVVHLEHADAARAAELLKAILTLASFFGSAGQDIRITADERGNHIIISAREETMQRAAQALRWLDGKVE